MQNKYAGKYLLSDVDGTLMTEIGEISEKNIQAIKQFCAQGGKFGLATGRTISTSRKIAERVGVNAPCILYNGAVVYDFAENKVLFMRTLPQEIRQFLKMVVELYPKYRATVATIQDNIEVGARKDVSFPATYIPKFGEIDDITTDWIKIVFHVPTEERLSFMAWLQDAICDGVCITSSSVHFVEILPQNCSKGSVLETVVKAASIPFSSLYVIGDYYNDKEMLQKALHSACPQQAPDDIKSLCSMVVCHVDDDAVAEYIDKI